MVLGEKTRGNGSNRIQVCQATEAASSKTVLGRVLGFGVLNGIFEVNVGVNVGRCGRSQRSIRGAPFIGLRRQRWRDRVGRCRKTGTGLLGRKGPRGYSSEALLSSPEVIPRLRDIDRLRPSSQGQAEGRVGVGAGRSHVLWMLRLYFLCWKHRV